MKPSTSRRPQRKRAGQYHHGDLRRALIDQALRTIDKEGVEGLTLRAVGEALGVSRTALYRHFSGKQALVAGVAREGFRTLRLALVDPGPEVGGAQVREGQQEIREVALRVDRDRRHAVERRLLDQVDAEAGLAAPGHAHADRVRDQVLGVVEERLGGTRLLRQVVGRAEIELPELLVDAGIRRWLRSPR